MRTLNLKINSLEAIVVLSAIETVIHSIQERSEGPAENEKLARYEELAESFLFELKSLHSKITILTELPDEQRN